MKKTLTFIDFSWRSIHSIPSKHGAASLPHWHSYRARIWFNGPIDQDQLVDSVERVFQRLNGCSLNSIVAPDSSDESLAEWLLSEASSKIGDCIRVMVENDGRRGAEASR